MFQRREYSPESSTAGMPSEMKTRVLTIGCAHPRVTGGAVSMEAWLGQLQERKGGDELDAAGMGTFFQGSRWREIQN